MIYKFISVVVPAYNEEKYITSCLESLDIQNYPKNKYEIIVELSGSNDKTEEIAKSFGAKITNTGTKDGVASARQNGSKAANGEIIAQTDADTRVPKDWLAKINQVFQRSEVIGVTGAVEFTQTNWFYKSLAKFVYPIYLRMMFLFGKSVFTGMNFAIRKETFDKIGGFNTKLLSAEDVDLGIRAGRTGKIVYDTNLVVYTSARRIEKSPIGFLKHHTLNSINYLFQGKSRGFEDIR
jgi:cellulose synthase/poly-beta-1,6-N-acetylglucosamine synthase-like glycosyltransferase